MRRVLPIQSRLATIGGSVVAIPVSGGLEQSATAPMTPTLDGRR